MPDQTVTFESDTLREIRERLLSRCLAEGRLVKGADEQAIDAAIEALLEDGVEVADPSEEEMRRYYHSHPERFRVGDAVAARHILYQVTPHVPVPALRGLAETHLGELLQQPEAFADYARRYSNCPSAQLGGQLGQINRGDVVPEFEKELFTKPTVGLQRSLITTRFGFHIVAIDHYFPGRALAFEEARGEVEARMRQQLYMNALVQFVRQLEAGGGS